MRYLEGGVRVGRSCPAEWMSLALIPIPDPVR